MPFPAKAIANEFLDIAEREERPITPLKLQKLIYFAHGWHLAIKKTPLIDRRIAAWRYGPVIPAVYGEFKQFGNEPITDYRAIEGVFQNGRLYFAKASIEATEGVTLEEKEFAHQLCERIWQVYGWYSASQLSAATHNPGTPWNQVYDVARRDIEIPDELIRQYFGAQLERQGALQGV